MRTWHYLRENKRNTIPKNILFLDSETRWTEENGHTIHQAYMIYACLCRLKNGSDTEYGEQWMFFDTGADLWEWVDALVKRSRNLSVVASNVLFDFAATGGFRELPKYGWTHSFDVSAGMRFILKLKSGQRYMTLLSSQNWIPYSVSKLGEMLGLEKESVDFENTPYNEIREYCRRDVEILKNAVLEYIRFVRRHDLGNFAYTISGQALNAYRHRFMGGKILIHNSEFAADLERACYFGGRNEVYKLGPAEADTVVSLDINSMYPHVMKENEYPTIYKNYLVDPTLKYVKNALKTRCMVAEIEVDTETPVYAKKIDGRTCFPVGRFRANVCTQGLMHAIRSGEVVKIYRAAEYEKAPIFTAYINFFYALKQRYDMSGEKIWYRITKLFMNSLYGKFGQQYDNEIFSDTCNPELLYRDICYDNVTKERFIEQALFGRKTRVAGKQDSQVTFTAIAAHVTENARFYLWEILTEYAPGEILYCDTDSIFVPAESVGKFRSIMHPDKLGRLSVEKKMKDLVINGCKDYSYEGGSALKGIRSDAEKIGPNEYIQGCWLSLKGMMRENINDGYAVRQVKKHLSREYTKGVVDSSGAVSPISLSG